MKDWEASYLAGIIDGEGSITLTRIHKNEHRRPCITIASTDKELLDYVSSLTGGIILNKKNYNPKKHKDSYTLTIKKKDKVLEILNLITDYLRVERKKQRAKWILENYDMVTPRNGKYNTTLLEEKRLFEEKFFEI
ncbi:LAGLIDADG family homing endonuclease [Bacillaceae bacterium CLA-AA-H227]|uniref:LAGLIDADG family homing endonuclease n=1 Tax=Robertmurraya yapensis (ex Hitch et al 2024) TaxID=3133160 RepID=A0ACC6SGB0_9BACI